MESLGQCVIISGKLNDKAILAKNRDRNYRPMIKLVQRIINGIQVCYLLDMITGWAEGMNEYGIGIVNTALMVQRDQQQGAKSKKGKQKSKDGIKIIKSLLFKTLEQAKDSVIKQQINGHTFVADKDYIYTIQRTSKHKPMSKKLKLKQRDWLVRTNHGYYYADAGYTKGQNLQSSKFRKKAAEDMLDKVNSEEDIGSGMQVKYGQFNSTFNINRDTDNMKTTSHYVMNLDNLTFKYYNKDQTTDFDGVDNKLPKDYKAKIAVIVK